MKFQNKKFVRQIWKLTSFLVLQGPFLELHECPFAVRLVLGPITSSQHATTITIKTRMFTFAPHFFDCGAKLWNVLALTHAKTLGPTKFFSTVTHSMRSYVKTYTTYLWMEWFLWPVHIEMCQIIQFRLTTPYMIVQQTHHSSAANSILYIVYIHLTREVSNVIFTALQ